MQDCKAAFNLGKVVLSESILVLRAKEGDQEAWSDLVALHQEGVFRLAYLKLGQAQEAEDVAQETFLRAYHHLHEFDESRPLRPWLLAICSNLAKNRHRARGRYWAALRRWARQSTEVLNRPRRFVRGRVEEGRQAARLWEMVRRMDPQDQDVLYYRFFMQLSVAETAQLLGVAAGTVKSRQHRALEKLRGLIWREAPDLAPAFKEGEGDG
jgi:RNA polymerase sigma factor (sigma-70 family)